MNTIPETATPPAATAAPAGVAAAGKRLRRRLDRRLAVGLEAGGLVAVVALSAVLNCVRLSQNGYANIFYSAGIRSMLRSFHNFVFVSFDPGGLISIDKPPLALWLQAASAKLFGFSPLSLLLPEAIIGVLTVAALYLIVARRLGTLAAFAAAVVLAVFPSFVAVSRDNGVDPLLVLLMLLACGAAIRACETGRWRSLALSAVLVGLAFNTKTLAAFLVLPGIVLAYLVTAPGPLRVRAAKLAAYGAIVLVVSGAWIAYVELTPASKRPYVGGSTDNTQLGLTFNYNGFGRVEGQNGGPGRVHTLPGARVPVPHRRHVRESAPAIQSVSTPFLPDGRYRNPIPFGSAPSPVRLWGKGLGDQDGWTVPIAVFGTIAIALLAFDRRRRRGPPPGAVAAAADGSSAAGPAAATDPHTDGASAGGPAAAASPRAEDEGRRDPRLATAIVLGGWFLVEGAVLSFSKGIVHPYYVSALAPATGAMAGGGIVAIAALRLGKRPRAGAILAALAVLGTVGAQVVLLHREQYLLWLIPVLIGGGALAVGVLLAVRSLTVPALAAAFCLLLIAPTAYSTTTWLAPVEGTFPAAGPKAATGAGGLGISGRSLRLTHALAAYIGAHRPGSRWSILTVASDASAPFILLGVDAGAVGGYSGTDPALDGRSLARLVSRGEARYVLLGGVYSSRGGNLATKAVLQACRQIAPHLWHDPFRYANGLGLFDCAGHERALAAAPSGGRT